jgi:hypothetical protein
MKTDFNIEFRQVNREFLDMRATLVNDVRTLLDRLTDKDKQVLRRTVYRAMFAYIEGLVSVLKKEMLLFRKQEGWSPQGKKMQFLTERRETTNRSGQTVTVAYFAPLSRSIPYIFQCYADIHWFEFEVDRTNYGWRCLLEAVNKRNRITHPKCSQDLVVTNAEIRLLIDGAAWFDNSLRRLFDECGKACLWRSQALRRSVLEN